jgi:RNA-directed DNA polymerase
MEQVVERLRPYLLGWKAYFGWRKRPKVWRELDEGLRHRCGRSSSSTGSGRNDLPELKAWAPASTWPHKWPQHRHWWRNSGGLLNSVLTIAYFDRLGVPRLS